MKVDPELLSLVAVIGILLMGFGALVVTKRALDHADRLRWQLTLAERRLAGAQPPRPPQPTPAAATWPPPAAAPAATTRHMSVVTPRDAT